MAMRDRININISIPESLNKHIVAYTVTQDITRTEAIRRLVSLALKEPEASIDEFSGENSINCKLQLTKREATSANDYRIKHGLDKQTKFLADAIRRGVSIYLGGSDAN